MLDSLCIKAYNKSVKRRDFLKKIEAIGWTFVREGGNHTIYEKKGRKFQLSRHKEVEQGLVWQWERLNKQLDDPP